jgi:hypothetical protein
VAKAQRRPAWRSVRARSVRRKHILCSSSTTSSKI